ncbi:MAG: hypothetical protein SFV15_06540 [Polyangiaceae bacterium]|nr:hypothetical protein [Polyangiaceae bacterium]
MTVPDRRGGLSHRAVFWGLAVGATLCLSLGATLYWHFVHSSRTAARHIPSNFSALRIDVEQVIFFEPVRRHLFPLVNELPTPTTKSARRMVRLEQAADTRLAFDLRELVLSWDGKGEWVGIVTGKFPRQKMVPAIVAELKASGWGVGSPIALGGARQAFRLTGDLTLAEAEDGTILFGSPRAVGLGLAPNEEVLPLAGPGAVSVSGLAWERLANAAQSVAWLTPQTAGMLTRWTGLRGRFQIGSEITLDLDIGLRSGSEANVEKLLAALNELANAQHQKPLPRAKVAITGASTTGFHARIEWPKEAALPYAELAARAILAAARPPAQRP